MGEEPIKRHKKVESKVVNGPIGQLRGGKEVLTFSFAV